MLSWTDVDCTPNLFLAQSLELETVQSGKILDIDCGFFYDNIFGVLRDYTKRLLERGIT
jgi:hypothetical protein